MGEVKFGFIARQSYLESRSFRVKLIINKSLCIVLLSILLVYESSIILFSRYQTRAGGGLPTIREVIELLIKVNLPHLNFALILVLISNLVHILVEKN